MYFVYNLSGRLLQTWENDTIIKEVSIDQVREQYCPDQNMSDWRTVQYMGKITHQDRIYVRDNFTGEWMTTEYLDVSSGKLYPLDYPVKGCLVIGGNLVSKE